jgi:beta-glucanase (GH16 family)
VADSDSSPSSEIVPGRSWRHFARVLPFASLLLLAGFGRCGGDATSGPVVTPLDAGTLLWSDEFEGTIGSAPDPSNWNYDVGTGSGGWGNNQLEYDTDSTANIYLDGSGHLAITALHVSKDGSSYTSGRINTAGKFAQTYGRIEASIKLPEGAGLWPAFWMLGCTNGTSWPMCGEIDIMEQQGQAPTVNHGSMHGPAYSGGGALTAKYYLTSGTFADGFHLFAIDWTADEVDFSVDGTVYEQQKKSDLLAKNKQWVFDHDFYVIVNLAVGGNFVGSPNAGTAFPATMLVDYVRVYGPAQ